MRKVISLLLTAIMIVGTVVPVLSAQPAVAESSLLSDSPIVETYPTRGFLYTDVYTEPVDKADRCILEEVELDGLPALKVTPNKQSTMEDWAIAVDNYSLKGKIGNISLDVYKYITLIYKYEGTRHTAAYPELYIGSHSGEIAGGATPAHVETTNQIGGWAVSVYEIPDLTDKYKNPDAVHNLNHFHLMPFGAKKAENYLSKIPDDAVIYIQGIAFSSEKPEDISVSMPYLKPVSDGVFGASKAFTRADACTALALLSGYDGKSAVGKTSFSDVPEGLAAYNHIAYCESKGYLSGFGKSFEPFSPISRGELACLLIRAVVSKDGNLPIIGSAIPSIGGSITRAEAAFLINTVFGIGLSGTVRELGLLYSDVGSNHWATCAIVTASTPYVSVVEKGETARKWLYYPEVKIEIGEAELQRGIEKLSEIERLEWQRISEIRATDTDVNVSGKAYFFANHGSDANSGLSPDNPKKTLTELSTLNLKAGDGVFFNRGDIFRGSIKAVRGVTYSAYGTGNKPIISMSPGNFTGKSNWELTDTPNVYKLKTAIEHDVGLVVFDGGDAWSEKRIKGRPDFVEGKLSDLDKDLTMWHDVASPTNAYGYLYLRSDSGNPGERFSSIELSPRKNVISAASDIVVDNLHITNTGAHGVGSGDVENLTVQNCEFSWIGGSWFRTDTLSRYGNAVEVYGGCDGYTVENCYIYQVYDAGVTHQLTKSPERECLMKDVRYINNVITDTSYPVEYFIAEANEGVTHLMQNIEISGNVILRTGLGFGDQRPDKEQPSAIKGWDSHNMSENFVINNNIFALSKYRMLQIGVGDSAWTPTFFGNTYLQYADGDFGNIGFCGNASYDYAIKQYIDDASKDGNAEVYYVPNPFADIEQ